MNNDIILPNGFMANNNSPLERIRKDAIDNGLNPDFEIFKAYWEGMYGLQQDKKVALDYLKRSADGGFAKGQYSYAWVLAHGTECDSDIELAYSYACKSAEQGYDKAIELARDIKRTLLNFNYKFFVDISAGNVARYDEEKNWFVMKRCYDTMDDGISKACPAGQEVELNGNCFLHPLEFDTDYKPISEALYESFGVHWGVILLDAKIEADEVGLQQLKDFNYEVDGIDIVSTEQLHNDLQAMQKPTDTFFYFLNEARKDGTNSDVLLEIGRAYSYGRYGLGDSESFNGNNDLATGWFIGAYQNGSDEALRELYNMRYFQNKVLEKVHNPEPVENADKVISTAMQLPGDQVFAMAQRYALGKGVPRNYAFSAQLLKIAADKGYATALYTLTKFKEYGFLDGDYYVKSLFDDYVKAYEMGCKPAAEKAASMAMQMNDVAEAAKYYKLSGDNGNEDSMVNYIRLMQLNCTLEGGNMTEINRSALAILRSLPQDNISVNAFWATIYSNGLSGVLDADYDKAWEYFSKNAYDKNYSDEITNITNGAYPFTSLGFGMDYDYPLPKEPLIGSGGDMCGMACMILNGKHGDKVEDHDMVMKLLSDAADRLCPEAILLQNAIIRGDDDEKINRLMVGEYTNDELKWIIGLCSCTGDDFRVGLYQFMLNLKEQAEQTEE